MSKKSTLLFALVMLLTAVSFAQSSYTDALTRYFTASGRTPNVESMRSPLIGYTGELRNNNDVSIPGNITSEQVVDRYLREQIVADFVALYVPYIQRAGITIDQLAELAEMAEQPEVAESIRHCDQVNTEDAIAILQSDVVKIMQGKKVSPVVVNASPQRCALFSQYYKVSEYAQIAEVLLNIYLKDDDEALSDTQVLEIKQYFDTNFENLMLLAAQNSLSDDDLRNAMRLMSMPQYSKFTAAIMECLSDPDALGTTLLNSFENWVNKNYNDDEELEEIDEITIIEEDEEPIMNFTEEMPEFPGGMESMVAFLQKEVRYPESARKAKIQGTVVVQFVVEKDGKVTNAKAKVSLNEDCDKEACRAIMAMPKWKPAMNQGQPVRSYYMVPISFSL